MPISALSKHSTVLTLSNIIKSPLHCRLNQYSFTQRPCRESNSVAYCLVQWLWYKLALSHNAYIFACLQNFCMPLLLGSAAKYCLVSFYHGCRGPLRGHVLLNSCFRDILSSVFFLSNEIPFTQYLVKWKLLLCLESQFCQITFCWGTQVKGYLAKADPWKNVFLKQTQIKGCCDIANKWKGTWRSINMSTCMYWFSLHSIVISACEKVTKELLTRFLQQLTTSTASSQAGWWAF